MALLPFILEDEMRPRRLRDELFGLDLHPDNFLIDILDRPVVKHRKYVRPWRHLAAAVQDVGSTIKCDKDKFQVNLDVQHFAPEELSIKTEDGFVVIEGSHEEKKDDHGFISRKFTRRYALPEDCKPERVESKLSSDGVLTILAPKCRDGKDARIVPMIQTGPVRRKHHDEEEREREEGRDEEEEPKIQKRRKR